MGCLCVDYWSAAAFSSLSSAFEMRWDQVFRSQRFSLVSSRSKKVKVWERLIYKMDGIILWSRYFCSEDQMWPRGLKFNRCLVISECLFQIDAAVSVRNRTAVYSPLRGTPSHTWNANPAGSTTTSLELDDGGEMSRYTRKEECKSF